MKVLLRRPQVADGDAMPADWLSFLEHLFAEACIRLGCSVVGRPVVGPCGSSIGARVQHSGEYRWLRVAPFLPEEMDREWWTGNYDARPLEGVPRPEVFERVEWVDQVEVGADLMAYVPDRPCAPFRDLEEPFHAGGAWWSQLRASLDALAALRSDRDLSPMNDAYQRSVTAAFGSAAVPEHLEWSTQHADLHWGHLTVPDLHILDWEHWGPAVHGLGPATLYCFSLTVPEVAAKVRQVFADVLDSPSGRYAQLCVIADRIDVHDPSYDGDLGVHLRRLAHELLDPAR